MTDESPQINGSLLIECSEKDLPRDIKIIPLKDFLEDHKKRFVLRTSKGALVLKRISHLDAEEVVLQIAKEVPDFFIKSQKANALFKVYEAGGEMRAEDLMQLEKMSADLEPYMKRFAMRCFVSPVVKSIEELDAIYTALLPAETNELKVLLKDLSQMKFDGQISNQNVTIAKEFGIPLTKETMTLDEMTERQVMAYHEKIVESEEMTRKALER